MPKRSRTARDENETAFDAVQRVIRLTEGAAERQEKNPAAVALGRQGGLKGGPARAEQLSPERRREIALRAAQTRWKDRKRDSRIASLRREEHPPAQTSTTFKRAPKAAGKVGKTEALAVDG
jgi:hypothetical protein